MYTTLVYAFINQKLVYTHTHTNPSTAKPWYTDIHLLSLVCTHKPEAHPWFILLTHTCVDTHIKVSYCFYCMYALVTESPTNGLPGCIVQPAPTFVNCVYTTKILQ